MTTTHTKRDPLWAEIERALQCGEYIRYDGMFALTGGLDQVERKLQVAYGGRRG